MDGDRMLKVSVTDSQDGGWGLTQSYLHHADYHAVADTWLARRGRKTAIWLVQFKDVPPDTLPRMCLATPREIADWLKAAARGRGDTIVFERHAWGPKAHAAGTTDTIPKSWRFTEQHLDQIAAHAERAISRERP